MSELCIYNARRFSRRWDILKVFPIVEKKVSGREYDPYTTKYLMSELCIYNARRFSRRWDILKVFPIVEKKVSGRKYATITSNICAVRFSTNYAVSKNHKSRIRAKHCFQGFGIDIVTTDLLAVGKRMVCWAGDRLRGKADNRCLLLGCPLHYRA